VVFLTSEDYNESLKLFKYYNLSVNYSDCTILKTMMDNNVSVVVSFDSDFDKIKGIRRIYL
ncbi:MAG: PIN domain-containing protein, partial [Methanobrevibacter sp.]|nr:PIN domain-containing protein [Methanobrevibacter sp.]